MYISSYMAYMNMAVLIEVYWVFILMFSYAFIEQHWADMPFYFP